MPMISTLLAAILSAMMPVQAQQADDVVNSIAIDRRPENYLLDGRLFEWNGITPVALDHVRPGARIAVGRDHRSQRQILVCLGRRGLLLCRRYQRRRLLRLREQSGALGGRRADDLDAPCRSRPTTTEKHITWWPPSTAASRWAAGLLGSGDRFKHARPALAEPAG